MIRKNGTEKWVQLLVSRGRVFDSCSSAESTGLFRLVPAEMRLAICEAVEQRYGVLQAMALCITCKGVFSSLVPWLCSDRIIKRCPTRMYPPINARTHCIVPRVAPRDQGPSTISRYLGTWPIFQERGLRSNVEVRCFLRQPTACPLIRIRLQSRTQLDHVLDKGRPGSGAVLHARAWNDRNRKRPAACCFVVD